MIKGVQPRSLERRWPSRLLERRWRRSLQPRSLSQRWSIADIGFLKLLILLAIAPATFEGHPTPTAEQLFTPGFPCVYEGHLKSDRNWFGYLANISVLTTGRMSFEFSYPAERCCQNILFYSDEQVSIISARMNCWQREYLLRPEEDQILRLSPRFSWSGCYSTFPNGIPTYVCEGGRSFAVDHPPATRPYSWFLAVSNCASLRGLDLRYRIVVHGHVGRCRSSTASGSYSNPRSLLLSNPRRVPAASASLAGGGGSSSDSICIIDGELNSSSTWFGFLVNMSLAGGGGFRFRFSYPNMMQVQSVILYDEDDVAKLTPDQTCYEKESVVRSRYVQDQVLDLGIQSSWNGCIVRNSTPGEFPASPRVLSCKGERRYEHARQIYVAVLNCRSRVGLLLAYHFEVHGYRNERLCSGFFRLDGKNQFFNLQLTELIVIGSLLSVYI